MKKNLARFMGEAKEPKKCPDGKYWCYTSKKCKKIPTGYHLGYRGYLEPDENKNGKNGNNSNGHSNGNGSSNGGSSGNGNGNGSGGNGGSNGGGGE